MRNKILILSVAFLFLLFSNGRFSIFFTTWISAALLLYWVRQHSKAQGFIGVWIILTLAWMFQFYGMVPVPAPFYIIIAIVYGLLGSLPYLIDLIFVKQPSRFLQSLIFPSSWALVDYLTQFTPYGSWGHAAYSQHTQLLLLQSISIFGMSYISFLIGWFASICNWLINQKIEWVKIKTGVLAYSGLMILTLGFGGFRLIMQKPQAETVRIASISAIEKEDQRLSPELQGRLFSNQLTAEDENILKLHADVQNKDLFDRSIREANAGAKIIFWGEANATAFKRNEGELFELASQLAKEHQIYLGMGLATLNLPSEKPLENKLVLFNPLGEKVIDYWKAIPVPGGEASISATKGKLIQRTETQFGTVAGAICFDMDFPQHLKQAKSVDIFLAPSNDWQAIDPWHTHMARFRAIEQGFNMVRHTSNGLSVGSDYLGRVISEMDHYMDSEKILITHLPTKGITTLFSIIGDTFPLFCFIILIFTASNSIRKNSHKQ